MLEGLIKIILLPVTVVAGFFSSLNSTPQYATITPTPIEQNVIVATGTISEQNVTVDLSVTMPKDGGDMAGTISGPCQGEIKGNYDGQENGIISGTLVGTCGMLFVSMDATGTFTGTVSKTKGEAIINYQGKADTYTKSGSVKLTFDPISQ